MFSFDFIFIFIVVFAKKNEGGEGRSAARHSLFAIFFVKLTTSKRDWHQ